MRVDPERDVLRLLVPHRAVLLVDDVRHDMPHVVPTETTRVGLLARPFTATELVAEVERLIG